MKRLKHKIYCKYGKINENADGVQPIQQRLAEIPGNTGT